eukprot:tig00021179_g19266.t1
MAHVRLLSSKYAGIWIQSGLAPQLGKCQEPDGTEIDPITKVETPVFLDRQVVFRHDADRAFFDRVTAALDDTDLTPTGHKLLQAIAGANVKFGVQNTGRVKIAIMKGNARLNETAGYNPARVPDPAKPGKWITAESHVLATDGTGDQAMIFWDPTGANNDPAYGAQNPDVANAFLGAPFQTGGAFSTLAHECDPRFYLHTLPYSAN